jgi:RNA polymerase sigma factor (sigma-70 family)
VGVLLRRLRREGRPESVSEVARALAASSDADLYLAVGCEARDPQAWQELGREFIPRLEALVLRRGGRAEEAHEIARETIHSLYAPPRRGGEATGLGTYDGSVRLFSWLAVILLRRLADVRRARRELPVDPAMLSDGQGGHGSGRPGAVEEDPLRQALDAESARRLDGAFQEALSRLSPRATLAILCKYRDGLQQTQIARLLGIGEPRVSRLLSEALRQIRAAVLRRFPDSADVASDRTRRALVEVLARRLATSAPARESLGDGGALHE